jgi:sporulation protein YlmC with PRC-barrel domain
MPKPDKILARELLEREVLDLTTGQVLGRVIDFALTREGRVAQIGVLINAWYEGGRGIAPAALASVHHDHVCIEDGAALVEFAPDGEQSFSLKGDGLLGKHVLQQDGELLGDLADFSFDLAEGRISDLIVRAPSEKRIKVPVAKIRTIGRDFIVIERGALSAEAAIEPVASEDSMPAPHEPVADAARAPAPAAEAASQAGQDQAGAGTRNSVLFGDAQPSLGLSRFDEKKRDYLLGRRARRDIKTAAGEVLIGKGAKLDERAIRQIIKANLLNDVFIEMTLKE